MSEKTDWKNHIRKPDVDNLKTHKKSGSSAYPVTFVAGTIGNLRFIRKTLKDLGLDMPCYQRALAHLINARLVDNAWHYSKPVPVPYAVWRSIGGRITSPWKPFEEAGFLKVTGSCHDSGICRTFRLTDEFMDHYYESTLDCDGDFRAFNIVNSKRTTKKLGTRTWDENRKSIFSDPVCQAALKDAVHRPCYFKLDAVHAETDLMIQEAKRSGLAIDRNRARVALKCVSTITTGVGRKQGWYIPTLVATLPGRVHEVGGGLQAASERIKWAAWQHMIDQGIAANYDLSCSQMRILLRIANSINTRERGKKWLVELRNDRNHIKTIAKRFRYDLSAHTLPAIDVASLKRFIDTGDNSFRKEIEFKLMDAGVPWDSVKRVIYGTVMGMKRSGFYEIYGLKYEPWSRDPKIEGIFSEVCGILDWLIDIIDDVSDRLLLMFRFYLSHRQGDCYLGMPDLTTILKVSSQAKGLFITNACDRTVHILSPEGNWIRDQKKEWYMGRVMAHLLQGAEAYHIAHLTLLQEEGGFRVLSNQHDGLVVFGKIPKECQSLAAKRSGLGNAAVLVEKSFNRTRAKPGHVVTAEKVKPRTGVTVKLPDGAIHSINTRYQIGTGAEQIQEEAYGNGGGES